CGRRAALREHLGGALRPRAQAQRRRAGRRRLHPRRSTQRGPGPRRDTQLTVVTTAPEGIQLMPGLLRGVARTAVIAGTATSVSNRVSRRQAQRWSAQAPPEQYAPAEQYSAPPPP